MLLPRYYLPLLFVPHVRLVLKPFRTITLCQNQRAACWASHQTFHDFLKEFFPSVISVCLRLLCQFPSMSISFKVKSLVIFLSQFHILYIIFHHGYPVISPLELHATVIFILSFLIAPHDSSGNIYKRSKIREKRVSLKHCVFAERPFGNKSHPQRRNITNSPFDFGIVLGYINVCKKFAVPGVCLFLLSF